MEDAQDLDDKIFKNLSFEKKLQEQEDTLNKRGKGEKLPRNAHPVTRKPLDIDLHFGSRFNVPQEVLDADPDYIYGFIPYMQGGESLQDIIDDAVDRGWVPVKKSEHPSLARRYFTDVIGDKKDFNQDYIRKGGQILMKRLKEYQEAEEAHHKKLIEIQAEEIERTRFNDRNDKHFRLLQ